MEKETQQTNNIKKKIYVLDTAFFIKIQPLNLNEDEEYWTTEYVSEEIKDKKSRDHFDINKQFIKIQNPSKESMKKITIFAKKSKDLFNLSVPDLSVLALTLEFSKNANLNVMEQPLEFKIIKKDIIKEKEELIPDDDGFVEVKSKKPKKEEESEEKLFAQMWGEEDEDWITPVNIDKKMNKFMSYSEAPSEGGVFLITDDFTVQNVGLKMCLNILSVNGLSIKSIKNYLLKCYSCNFFNFDTEVLFCQECGYNTLMKIGYRVNYKGEGIIYDKEAEKRMRGVQFDLPKPTIGKKATIYILAEDQLPNYNKKKNDNIEENIEKILENYSQYKDLLKHKKESNDGHSSKNLVWGYPKQNPNVPKKYYGKKQKINN